MRLTGRVAGESHADLLRARLRLHHGVLDHAGIGPHHAVEILGLAVDRVQEADDGLVAALQDRVDLGVGGIECLGGGEDRLALILRSAE